MRHQAFIPEALLLVRFCAALFARFMPVEHYENFPVASLLMPARLRPAVEAIYHFARSADDIADEGEASAEERLQALASYREGLRRIEKNEAAQSPLFAKLHEAVRAYALPMQPLADLLCAFEQDVVTKRYADYASLLDYCRRSANPVGRLMLALYGKSDQLSLARSDAICSALQLTNFLQDVAIDLEKERIYLPLEDLDRYGVNEAHLVDQAGGGQPRAAWQALMRFQVTRTRDLMLQGAPLALTLPGRIGWELRLVVQGGLRILERIEQANYDVFRHRPTLGKSDYMLMLLRALSMSARR